MVEAGSARPRIFISYSRRDMAFADRLEAALKAHGFDPLIDRSEIYAFEGWWPRIKVLIARADTIIFVLSPDAVASEVCGREVAFAASLNKRFAPIVHRQVEGQPILEGLARLNSIFFGNEDRFDDAMNLLVEALSTDIEWIRKHTEFGEQALRWAEAGRPGPRGLLLHSPVLEEAERWIASRPAGAPAPTEATQSFIAESRRASTRRRNLLSASLGAGLVVALGLAGLAYWQRGIAVRQEQIATEQRSLAEKNEAQAKIELDKALLTQSRFLANVANQSVDFANGGTAMAVSLEALPDSRAGNLRPYAPEAESALFSSWQALREIRILQGHSAVSSAQFSPDGRRIFTAEGTTARIWDVETGKVIAVLEGHEGLWSAQFSPDGRRVVTVSIDKTARISDVESGKVIAVRQGGHDDWVLSAAFSPDGRRVVTTSRDETARIWDAKSGNVIRVLKEHDGYVESAAFSPDGRRVVTASIDKTARIWDVESGNVIAVLQGHEGWVVSAEFSSDGRRIVTASADKTARIWDAESGKVIVVLRGHEDSVNSATFSPDGRRVVTASDDKLALIWDAESGQVIAVLQGHAGGVSSAAFSPDGRRVVTTSNWEGVARIWDAENGKVIAVLRVPGGGVSSAEFSPDGRRVVTVSRDDTARIWDAESGKVIAVLQGHDDKVLSATFSPDGRRILTASADKTARMWDAETGGTIAVLQGHEDKVLRAAFSPDGRRVVTASADKTSRIWDAESGEVIAVLQDDDWVGRAPFSPDGRRVVTVFSAEVTVSAAGAVTTQSNAVRIWDAESGKVIAVLERSEYPFRSAAFSPDGRRVLTGDGDWIARIWRVFPWTQELIDEAKRVAPRCLTRTERAKAFLDPKPPTWCIEMEKWPYQSQDWKDWLKFKRANANPPLPDTPEWKKWITDRVAK